PVIAGAALGVVPDLSGLHWRWAPGAPIALWLAEPSGQRVENSVDAAELVHQEVVEGHLNPLREAMRGFVRLADGLMWGNAASALAGTRYAGTQRPDLTKPVDALVKELFTREPLRGTGTFGTQGFVRRSCCLYYRIPPGGQMCGDCVLLHR
ncbi:(2Fe-2S)-binding protein, partial [Actinomadura adrarensis]